MKWFSLVIIIVVIILIIAYFALGIYFYNLALNPKTSKTFVLGKKDEKTDEQIRILEENIKWLSEHSKDVYINSNSDHFKLHAYEIRNEEQTDKWIIVIHGYMGEGKSMTSYARNFYDRGYNILMIDLRGHGLSEGDYIGMGWPDRLDVISWSNYLIAKNKESKIILFGVSMGAATVMMATGETLPSNIKLAIEDCGYTSVWDEFKMQLKTLFDLPTFPVLNAASTVCNIKAGYKLEQASSIEQLKKSKTPTLFIHGSEDTFVPFKMLEEVYQSANCEKEKLVVKGAKHAESSNVDSKLYWETIDKFIEKYIE